MRRFWTCAVLFGGIFLMLAGCGGGSGSGTFNPVPSAGPAPAAGTSAPIFSNTSSAAGKYTISFSVDRPTVDTTVGQVLGTASLTSSTGANIAGRLVTFSVVAGPASINPGLLSVPTDSGGKAVTIIVPGDAVATTNVILQASTTINGQTIRAYAPLQIVRGSGVITFLTGKAPTDPDGTLFTLEETVDATFAGVAFEFMQQLPFKVTDANGNPRVGVPVTLSVEDRLTGRATIGFSDPAATTATLVTDSNGKAIFNVGVTMTAPPPGVTHTDSVIYRAVTTEAAGTPQLVTYAGFVIAMTTKSVPLSITPGTAAFGAGINTIDFIVTGGVQPYAATSSNGSLVSVTISGSTVRATLVNPGSTLSVPVTISVTDRAGNSASATVTTTPAQ